MFPIFPWDLNSLTFFFPWVKLVFHYTGVQLLSCPGLQETTGCVTLGMMLTFWTQFLDDDS